MKVDVTKCHACHAKRRGIPARPGNQARHQSQPSAISATPATQSDDPCHQVPRLPHKVKVDVTKCHACHAKRRGVPAQPGNQARHRSQPSAISATPATQRGQFHVLTIVCEQVVCEQVVCEEVVCVSKLCVSKLCVRKLHVIKCHACHTK